MIAITIILCAVITVMLYCCCIVAGRCDREMEADIEKYQSYSENKKS